MPLHRHYFAQALSPDGRTLAFLRVQTHSPPWARFVKLLPNGEIVQLTRDATRKMHPVCSPQMAEHHRLLGSPNRVNCFAIA